MISLRIADHFQSREHVVSFTKHLKDALEMCKTDDKLATVSHPLTKNSLLARVKVDMGNKVLPLNEMRLIKVDLEVNPCISGLFDIVDVEFNIDTKKTFVMQCLFQHRLPLQKNLELALEPSDFVLQEDMLEMKSVVLRSSHHHVEAICRTMEIDFSSS